MVNGSATPGAIARALAAEIFASAGATFALGDAALASDAGTRGLPADARPLGFVFLRKLVESKPVELAPEAGGEKLAGGPSCTRPGCVNFWKTGGRRGSVCRLGASGSAYSGGGVCAVAFKFHITAQKAMSK